MTRHTVIGVILLLGLAACTSRVTPQTAMALPNAPIPPASSSEALAAGAHLAQQHCVRCHAEGNRDGQAAPLDLTGQAWTGHAWHHPDSVLVQMIADGIDRPTGVMPPFGSILRPDEIRTLIAFIKTFWTPEQLQLQQERTQRADFTVYRH
jgi:mono/diheme cytochrome c family protein